MKQKQEESAARPVDCARLAVELVKIPQAYWPQILRDSLVFIADMESARFALRLIKTVKPCRQTGSERGKHIWN